MAEYNRASGCALGYIRLSFAFRRKEPCCDRGEYNNDEADDDAPAIQPVSLATLLFSQIL